MIRKVFALGVAVALLSGVVAYAHHSFEATYYRDRTLTLEGNLSQFMFRNPHSFIHLMVKDKDGQEHRWAVEWGGGGQLARSGVTRDTLRVGDHVILTVNPSRSPEDRRVLLVTLVRPVDGWKWGEKFD